MAADENEHHFDRRSTDVNVAALAVRVIGLEGRVEGLEGKAEQNNRELRANTVLTKQVHEAVFGAEETSLGVQQKVDQVHSAVFGRDEEDSGIKGKVEEVHDVFTEFKRGFALLNRVADAGTRWGKPLFFVVLICGAIITYFKTGEWKLPAWPS